MSLIIHCEYSCYTELANQLPGRIKQFNEVASESPRLKIGLVNLMPEKAATERQWFKVMASSEYWIEPQLIRMGTYQSTYEPDVAFSPLYKNSFDLVLDALDAIIVTGAPIEHLDFEAVAYWDELDQFFSACLERQIPLLGICWAAQALLYKRFGIQKYKLPQKCFGVFEHQAAEAELGLQLGQSLYLPHSRHTGWQRRDLEAVKEITVLIDSEEAGPFALRDEKFNYYFSGHGEYEPETLIREYQRDIEKNLPIEVPKGYLTDVRGGWARQNSWDLAFGDIFNQWLKCIIDGQQVAAGRC